MSKQTPGTFSLAKLHRSALTCPTCGASQHSAVTTWDAETERNWARVTFTCGHVFTRPLQVGKSLEGALGAGF